MKTILQIAKEIGVTKQAVYKRYKGKLYPKLIPYIHTIEGTAYISERGITLIKNDFLKDGISEDGSSEYIQDTPLDISEDTQKDTPSDILIQVLQKEIEIKNKQIENISAELTKEREHSRNQSDKILGLADQLASLNKNNQVLLREAQEKTAILLPEKFSDNTSVEPEKKKGFFKKRFGKK